MNLRTATARPSRREVADRLEHSSGSAGLLILGFLAALGAYAGVNWASAPNSVNATATSTSESAPPFAGVPVLVDCDVVVPHNGSPTAQELLKGLGVIGGNVSFATIDATGTRTTVEVSNMDGVLNVPPGEIGRLEVKASVDACTNAEDIVGQVVVDPNSSLGQRMVGQ